MPSTDNARQKMEKSLDALRREFSGVRTGKATPALLDTVRVDAYGSHVPLNQVATVNAPEPRLLLIQPWDRAMLGPIEKAIQTSDLGFNPSNDGKVVRIPVPPLTEERRREYARMLHKMAEDARISVRQARHDALADIKERQKEKEISEDEARREEKDVQKLTDQYVEKVEELLKSKEAEVMEV
ncbi:MAG TPA: ribosome recycling factor [Longimicrobiaceae bacterium]|nr:ribosome recycling factor [Longimicrobiaceae bacterium]